MSRYAEDVVRAVLGVTWSDGRGGYLRIMTDADPEHAQTVLTEERDAAQVAVGGMQGPSAIQRSSAMQILILTSLLLSRPDRAVDLRVVSEVQDGVGIPQSLEMAAKDLAAMFGRTLEIVERA